MEGSLHWTRRLLFFVREVARRFLREDGLKLSASLAYTTLLALVPLVTIGLAVFSAFPAFKTFTGNVNDFVSRAMLPPTVEQIVATHLEQFTRSAGRLTALGIAVLAVTALLLMQTIDAALQRIFSVHRRRALSLRVLTYWGVLTLGPLLIGASISITSYVVTLSIGVNDRLGAIALLDFVPVVLTAIAFTLLYKVVPNRQVGIAHALAGGLFAAVLFEAAKRAFALYIAAFPTYTLIYGAFAAIPIFLLWIYLSWVVVLLGAVLAAALPDWRAAHAIAKDVHAIREAQRAQLLFNILRVLLEAQRDRLVLSSGRVAAHAPAPLAATELLLDKLADAGWVVRASGERWALGCDPHTLTLAQIYRRILFGHTDDALLARLSDAHGAALDVPLAALLETSPDE
jgi:membrane protein